MKIKELMKELDERFPKTLSCDWDNDGLMVSPDPEAEIRKILLALDASDAVVDYAVENGFDLLFTHHPMIFHPVRSITPEEGNGSKAIRALRGGLSVISLHTRLDAGEGGVNDALAEKLGLVNIRPFGTEDEPTLGRIGEVALYSSLSYDYFFPIVKVSLGAPALQTVGENRVVTVAVVGGAGGDFAEAALRAGADTFVTGEMGYNHMENAGEMGLNVICAGHYYTEAPVLEKMRDLLEELTGVRGEIYSSITVKIR